MSPRWAEKDELMVVAYRCRNAVKDVVTAARKWVHGGRNKRLGYELREAVLKLDQLDARYKELQSVSPGDPTSRMVRPDPPPRYDEVFWEGLKKLNKL